MGHGPEDYVAGYEDSWDREQRKIREKAEKARSTPQQCDQFNGREHGGHLWYERGPRGFYSEPASERVVHWCEGIHPETEVWKGRIVEFHQDGSVTWRKK